MTWRSREPRGPRKMVERLADRRSGREQGMRVRFCYSAYCLSQGVGMGRPAVHILHMHIWRMLPSPGLLKGFWDRHGSWSKWYKQLSVSIQSGQVGIKLRATLHHDQSPSILPLSHSLMALPLPFFRPYIFQLTASQHPLCTLLSALGRHPHPRK